MDIFGAEYQKSSDKFLQILVNSRVGIMHIKRNFSKSYLSGEESLLYMASLWFSIEGYYLNLLELLLISIKRIYI